MHILGGDKVLVLEGRGHVRYRDTLEDWAVEAVRAIGALGFACSVVERVLLS